MFFAEVKELGDDLEWEKEAAELAEQLRQKELEVAAHVARMAHWVVD